MAAAPHRREALTLPVCLIIMDGYGLAEDSPGNAISQAATPVLDRLFRNNDWVRLEASGEAVGLPHGQMGNSEVGHLNIGAGRVVFQELTRIDRAVADGSLAENAVLQGAFAQAKAHEGTVHLMGLLSDGGVHSSQEHLFALLEEAVRAGAAQVMVHCFLDGRDVPPSSAGSYIRQLEERISELSQAYPSCQVSIGSLSGRYYAMDRDKRWDRVQKAYDTIVCAQERTDLTPLEALEGSYDKGVTDEFVLPIAFQARGIKDGDTVIFFNFRPDRARELTRAIVDADFDGFPRPCRPDVTFVCLTEYDPTIEAPVAFPKEFPEAVLADVLAKAGLSQFHIAETEKYAHVTFFLNGGVEEEKAGEERVLIASPKVATYDLQPQMSEPEVASALAQAVRERAADVYIVNFANCDMVGHTGSIPAAIQAVEAVDAGVEEVLEAIREQGGVAFITADHGNADKMLSEDGTPHTAHTTALVPFILADFSERGLKLTGEDGALCDIAPTILETIGIPAPKQMTGKGLIASPV